MVRGKVICDCLSTIQKSGAKIAGIRLGANQPLDIKAIMLSSVKKPTDQNIALSGGLEKKFGSQRSVFSLSAQGARLLRVKVSRSTGLCLPFSKGPYLLTFQQTKLRRSARSGTAT